MRGHWSDCAVYNAPALIPGSCDCGGLELAVDPVHGTIVPLVANARCAGILVEDVEEGGFVEAQKFPSDRLVADASTTHLPDTRDRVIVLGEAAGVNLDDA